MAKVANDVIKEFKNKKILITGGTGSVGQGLIKQLVKCKPAGIRVFSNDENSIFETKRMLGNIHNISYLIGDIRDVDRLKLAIRDADIVFHAAAMKHVDLCEENPFDAVKTNVIGTSNVLEACLLEDVSKFVFISTDKSTNPSSTLGASKLLGERLTIKANSYRGSGKTIFSVVRFGNVIGSRGSVFQIFVNQLRNRTPLTVTDPKMTRFIMSLDEASLLILKAAHIAKDGETLILKMPSVRIEDLAKGLIKAYREVFPYEKILSTIKYSHARQGERFHEFLVTSDEVPFCHDEKNMYKLNRKLNQRKTPLIKFSSETAPKISKKNLHKIILELLNEDFNA